MKQVVGQPVPKGPDHGVILSHSGNSGKARLHRGERVQRSSRTVGEGSQAWLERGRGQGTSSRPSGIRVQAAGPGARGQLLGLEMEFLAEVSPGSATHRNLFRVLPTAARFARRPRDPTGTAPAL